MTTYQLPDPILKGGEHSYTIDTILSSSPATHLREGQRPLFGMVLPSWQRKEVWSIDQKRRFIEGIFLGLGTGYYVSTSFDWDAQGKRMPNAGLLLDGQQRLTALRDFVTGEFGVFGESVKYVQMSVVDRRRRFNNIVFPSVEMECTTYDRVLREIYDRLAFGGVPHKESERASHGDWASESPNDTKTFCVRCDGLQRTTAHAVTCDRCGGSGYEPR